MEGHVPEEYWDCTLLALSHPDGKGPLIVDDGGDATLLIHKGYELENGSDWVETASESHEEQCIKDLLKKVHLKHPLNDRRRLSRSIRGNNRCPQTSTDGGRGLSSIPVIMSTTPSPSRSSTISTAVKSLEGGSRGLLML